ncbi:MAG: hypothetical protein OXB84_08215, partial [Halobacteriovoraceae bacterium]|nr:hypothetical protein [Halobacteriovoraceae bacterium]
LGTLLLEFAKTPSYNEENLLTVIIINLCIASSLMLIPFTVKSLLGDGLTSSASVMAALPAVIASNHLKKTALKTGNQIKSQGIDSIQNKLKKSNKKFTGRFDMQRERKLKNKVAQIKKKAINHTSPSQKR